MTTGSRGPSNPALVEIGQTLGSFRGKFVVIGGAVPWLLLRSDDMQHVSTIDSVSRSTPRLLEMANMLL